MEKYYFETIQKLCQDLRNVLVTAICFYLEKDIRLRRDLKKGDETLIGIEPVVNDREHIVARETLLTFVQRDALEGPKQAESVALDKVDIEWLMVIYEAFSQNQL